MNQIMTILSANITPDKQADLKKAYSEVKIENLPDGLLSSHLIQSTSDSDCWEIITFWKSREALDAYRKSVETPAWFLVFRSVGVEPTMSVFDVFISR